MTVLPCFRWGLRSKLPKLKIIMDDDFKLPPYAPNAARFPLSPYFKIGGTPSVTDVF